MYEAQWLVSCELQTMLDHLRDRGFFLRRGKDRKLRLLGCACCRASRQLLADPRSNNAIEVSELFCEKRANRNELIAARNLALTAQGEIMQTWRTNVLSLPSEGDYVAAEWHHRAVVMAALAAAEVASLDVLGNLLSVPLWSTGALAQEAWARQASPIHSRVPWEPPLRIARERSGDAWHNAANLLRCIFGNPFRPVHIDPAWLQWNHRCVVSLAQNIYDQRRFGDLPILADALEEAGCTSSDILAHCRSGGEHVRGCWVVDLLLGKS